jgi:hypothetical protein
MTQNDGSRQTFPETLPPLPKSVEHLEACPSPTALPLVLNQLRVQQGGRP